MCRVDFRPTVPGSSVINKTKESRDQILVPETIIPGRRRGRPALLPVKEPDLCLPSSFSLDIDLHLQLPDCEISI
jgi:hypothetical protein